MQEVQHGADNAGRRTVRLARHRSADRGGWRPVLQGNRKRHGGVARGVRKVDRMSVLETVATALDIPLAELAAEAMAGAFDLRVPLVVDLKTGPNWRDLTPIRPGAG